MTPAAKVKPSRATPAIPENGANDETTDITNGGGSHDHHTGTFITPQLDPHFVVAKETKAFLRAVERLSKGNPEQGKDGRIINVGIRGPKGAGKTSLAEWYAAMTKRPMFVLDMPTLREPKDLFGFKDVVMTETGMKLDWKLSGFVRALQTERACIVLDEATRIHASVANGLLPLLDHRRKVYLDDLGERIVVSPGIVFFLTMNVGLQYTGTYQMDAALEDRLSYQLDVGYLDAKDEAQVLVNKVGIELPTAERLAEVAAIIRQRVTDPSEPLPHEVSTRQLIEAAYLIREGVTPLDAMSFTVVPTYSNEAGTASDRAHVLTILQGKLA